MSVQGHSARAPQQRGSRQVIGTRTAMQGISTREGVVSNVVDEVLRYLELVLREGGVVVGDLRPAANRKGQHRLIDWLPHADEGHLHCSTAVSKYFCKRHAGQRYALLQGMQKRCSFCLAYMGGMAAQVHSVPGYVRTAVNRACTHTGMRC